MRSNFRAYLPAALIAIGLCFTLAHAQKKPNVSGTWKMNPAKSKFSAPGGPEEMIIKFEQKEASLHETFTISEEHHQHSFELEYTLDGEKQTQEVDGVDGQVSAKWEGETLVLEWKIEGDTVQRKITLSADGKTMTMIARQSSPGSQTTDTVVLDKQ